MYLKYQVYFITKNTGNIKKKGFLSIESFSKIKLNDLISLWIKNYVLIKKMQQVVYSLFGIFGTFDIPSQRSSRKQFFFQTRYEFINQYETVFWKLKLSFFWHFHV